MLDFLTSIISPKEIAILLIGLAISTWFGVDNYSLKQEKVNLQVDLQKADSIIEQQQIIITAAAKADSAFQQNIDSIQYLRNENDTITINFSDIDSLRAIWSKQFGQ